MSNQIQIKGDFQFPTEWTLFGPVERGTAEPDFSAMTEPGLPAQPVSLRRDRGCWEVDLGALLGGVSEGKTAWLVTSLTEIGRAHV